MNIDVPDFRTSNDDYAATGYDRGHLAAAANWRHNPTMMQSTFSLLNVSPQVGVGFNRDYWAKYVNYSAKKHIIYACIDTCYYKL